MSRWLRIAELPFFRILNIFSKIGIFNKKGKSVDGRLRPWPKNGGLGYCIPPTAKSILRTLNRRSVHIRQTHNAHLHRLGVSDPLFTFTANLKTGNFFYWTLVGYILKFWFHTPATRILLLLVIYIRFLDAFMPLLLKNSTFPLLVF